MRPNTIDIDPNDASTTRYASNVTGATWTLTNTTPGDSLAHQVSILNDSVTDHSAKTAILTGTDSDGKVQTETVNLPGTSATIESTKYFLTLTSVVPSATIGTDTMDIGIVDEVASQTYPIDRLSDNTCNIFVDVTGTIDFTVQELWSNVYDVANPQQDATWINISALAAKTADTASTATKGATAVRIIVNSYSTTAELQMYTNQVSGG